jgi:hypothetical protein
LDQTIGKVKDMPSPSLLIVQSFIVSPEGSYWDYRDYLLCLASNLTIKDYPVRLNIERGMDSLEFFNRVADKHGFSNFSVTNQQPSSWSSFMVEQMNHSPAEWTMPWPGDHIYIHPDEGAFLRSVAMADHLDADAVVYGHTMDFEYFLNWEFVTVLHNDADYVMIEWGHRYRKNKNHHLGVETKRVVGHELSMPPVPGFAIYRSDFFKEVLNALPADNKRWQDMEFSKARCARKYKLLIPKQCFYRHVHGYWLEGFFKYWREGGWPEDYKREIETWYIRSKYDWEKDLPSRGDYLAMTLKEHPYFERYLTRRIDREFENKFGVTPFDACWESTKPSLRKIINKFRILVDDLRYEIKH